MGAATDVGRVRDGNEDAYLVDDAHGALRGRRRHGRSPRRRGRERHRARGAARRGHRAARPLRESIEDANDGRLHEVADRHELARHGHDAHRRRRSSPATRCSIGHVGDSRAYLLHDGELRRSPTTTAWSRSSCAKAGSPPSRPRSTRSARSSRARSASTPSVEVDVYTLELVAGDRLAALLRRPHRRWCATATSRPTLRREPDPQRAADALVDAANAAGGEDNITVVVVDVLDDDAAARQRPGSRSRRSTAALAARSTMRPTPVPGERRRRGVRGCAVGCCCWSSCRSCSCSASRSPRSAGTRASSTTSASTSARS